MSETGELATSSGSIPAGTSNIAEMLGVIHGLEYCVEHYPGYTVHVHSDSAYVINAWKDKWIANWEKRKWKTSRGRPVANQEYWHRMIELVDKLEVRWHHVKGHSGVPFNEQCDRLAGKARSDEIERARR